MVVLVTATSVTWPVRCVCVSCQWNKCLIYYRSYITHITIFERLLLWNWFLFWLMLAVKSINSLWPSDVIWQHRSESTLAQVVAWCLTAPSHFLNQCWLIISVKSSDIHIRAISQEKPQPSITRIHLKIASKISFKFPRGQWVNPLRPEHDV